MFVSWIKKITITKSGFVYLFYLFMFVLHCYIFQLFVYLFVFVFVYFSFMKLLEAQMVRMSNTYRWLITGKFRKKLQCDMTTFSCYIRIFRVTFILNWKWFLKHQKLYIFRVWQKHYFQTSTTLKFVFKKCSLAKHFNIIFSSL